jgi:excisionase family DNA binding protein
MMEEERKDELVTSPWMKAEVAAPYLGVSIDTLRNWTSARYVPFAKRGRVVRYHRDALDRRLSRGSCPGRLTIADLGK